VGSLMLEVQMKESRSRRRSLVFRSGDMFYLEGDMGDFMRCFIIKIVIIVYIIDKYINL
jgi:hypothetical protein